MHKFLSFFIFLTSLYATEPTLAKLVNIDSNNVQKYSIGNYTFYCRPYGVLTLDKLYDVSGLKSKCKEKIKVYYSQHPQDYYFAQNLFKRGQWYHIEFKKNTCVVYAQGQYTYSELLLEKGLAVRKPSFTDREFKASFYKAQNIAKDTNKGIWKDDITQNCIAEIYK